MNTELFSLLISFGVSFGHFVIRITLHFIFAIFQLYVLKVIWSPSKFLLKKERLCFEFVHCYQLKWMVILCICFETIRDCISFHYQIACAPPMNAFVVFDFNVSNSVKKLKKREMIRQTKCTRGEKERMEFFPGYIIIITCFSYVWIYAFWPNVNYSNFWYLHSAYHKSVVLFSPSFSLSLFVDSVSRSYASVV